MNAKKVLVLNGSMRKSGNTSAMVRFFLNGAKENTNYIEEIVATDINLKYCTGCLRCNILGKCALREDDWGEISQKILDADVLVLASPIYFHHVTAPLKKIIDRFRSLVNVQITETGLKHTPYVQWKKDFVLLLSMGSSDVSDAQPVIDLFEYMVSIFGDQNKLHVIKASRLAVVKQIEKSKEELEVLYSKMNLPLGLAEVDAVRNKEILKEAYELGSNLTKL